MLQISDTTSLILGIRTLFFEKINFSENIEPMICCCMSTADSDKWYDKLFYRAATFLLKKSLMNNFRRDLFNLSDKIIFYDFTNTYFEGRKIDSELAQFGRSKEKRC